MHLGKELAQAPLERLVLGALVELADEVAAGAEGLVGEGQGGCAEVLSGGGCVVDVVSFILGQQGGV